MVEVKKLEEVKPRADPATVEVLEAALADAKAGDLRGVLIIGETKDLQVASYANFADAERVIGYLERLKFRMLRVTSGE